MVGSLKRSGRVVDEAVEGAKRRSRVLEAQFCLSLSWACAFSLPYRSESARIVEDVVDVDAPSSDMSSTTPRALPRSSIQSDGLWLSYRIESRRVKTFKHAATTSSCSSRSLALLTSSLMTCGRLAPMPFVVAFLLKGHWL